MTETRRREIKLNGLLFDGPVENYPDTKRLALGTSEIELTTSSRSTYYIPYILTNSLILQTQAK